MAKRDIRLTPTSYIVLGLIAAAGRATPYELKQMHASGIGGFWTLNHAQLYAEPDRLVEGGFLTVEREEHGRRRKLYEVTAAGHAALRDWLAKPSDEFTELRDVGLLQLFFGADPKKVAAVQLRIHGEALAQYEALRAGAAGWLEGPRLVLESGIGHEREWLRFWKRVAEG
ncbi:MAG TPA: PadR family transcriptional regulator [Thermoleophilaceae bacterium]|jgi:DNA-binding PadR family transcriptional regulator